jgi:lysozyme family protein
MITFEESRQGYLNLCNKMVVRDDKVDSANAIVSRIIAHKADYQAVEAATGVPWVLVAGLHSRESDLNFGTYLGNGQPLDQVTTQVPKGRGPFSSWHAGAIDALRYDGLDEVKEWPIERIAYEAERYNGQGYFSKDINSPYVWSWSNNYTSGKYVADGAFDANAVDKQCGVMVLVKQLAGSIEAPHDPLPPQKPKPVPAESPIIHTTEGHIMFDLTALVKDLNIGLDTAEKLDQFLSFVDPPVASYVLQAIKAIRTIEDNLGVTPAAVGLFDPVAVKEATDHVTPGAPNSEALKP